MSWQRSVKVLWRSAPSYLALARIDGFLTEVYGPGDVVWELIEAPCDLEPLVEQVAERFGTSADVIHTEVAQLLEQLSRDGFVTRHL